MNWIRVDDALPTHRKSIELAEITGEDLAFGRMIRLWCWARVNAPEGRIAGRSPGRLVEGAAGWTGEAGSFVTAAVEVGFLDRDGDDLLIHDWDEHNGKAMRRAEEAAERSKRWREAKDAVRARKREAAIAAAATESRSEPITGDTEAAAGLPPERLPNAFGTRSRTHSERIPSAFGTHSRTHTERIPNVERDETRRDETRRDRTTTTAGQPTPQPPPSPVSRNPPKAFELEAESSADSPVRRLSVAQNTREELRGMRAAALPNVVDDVELKPGALTRTLDRIEHEASAKGATIADAYAAYLRDDYARSCDPPCPLALFVDANKFRECLSSALRAKGRGPPLLLPSGRRAGGYVSLTEIEAQDFTIDPAELADQEHP